LRRDGTGSSLEAQHDLREAGERFGWDLVLVRPALKHVWTYFELPEIGRSFVHFGSQAGALEYALARETNAYLARRNFSAHALFEWAVASNFRARPVETSSGGRRAVLVVLAVALLVASVCAAAIGLLPVAVVLFVAAGAALSPLTLPTV
jgi:hypothetical protein